MPWILPGKKPGLPDEARLFKIQKEFTSRSCIFPTNMVKSFTKTDFQERGFGLMNWFRRVMAGRYGIDQLGYALLIASVLFIFLRGVTGWVIFYLAGLAVMLFCYMRFFSRDFDKRRTENMRFMTWWRPLEEKLMRRGADLSDLRTHCHFKCPQCRQKVRVPRGRGRIAITCPGCHISFIRKT